MNALVEMEIQENKRKLDYYKGLKTRIETLTTPSPVAAKVSKKTTRAQVTAVESIEKWIEIYSSRVRSLERKNTKHS